MCHHLKAAHFWKAVQLPPLASNLSIGATPSPQALETFYCQNLSDADPKLHTEHLSIRTGLGLIIHQAFQVPCSSPIEEKKKKKTTKLLEQTCVLKFCSKEGNQHGPYRFWGQVERPTDNIGGRTSSCKIHAAKLLWWFHQHGKKKKSLFGLLIIYLGRSKGFSIQLQTLWESFQITNNTGE